MTAVSILLAFTYALGVPFELPHDANTLNVVAFDVSESMNEPGGKKSRAECAKDYVRTLPRPSTQHKLVLVLFNHEVGRVLVIEESDALEKALADLKIDGGTLAKWLGTAEGWERFYPIGANRILPPHVVTVLPKVNAEAQRDAGYKARIYANYLWFLREIHRIANRGIVDFVFTGRTENGAGVALTTLDAVARKVAEAQYCFILGQNQLGARLIDGMKQTAHSGRRGIRLSTSPPAARGGFTR